MQALKKFFFPAWVATEEKLKDSNRLLTVARTQVKALKESRLVKIDDEEIDLRNLVLSVQKKGIYLEMNNCHLKDVNFTISGVQNDKDYIACFFGDSNTFVDCNWQKPEKNDTVE